MSLLMKSSQFRWHSTDGVTFNKYENNPILDNITYGNRDPKVFWYRDKWIMIISLNYNP